MRFRILIVSVFCTISFAAPANDTRVERAIAAVKELCLVGTQFDLKADASGKLTLFKLTPGVNGSVSVDVRHSTGAAGIFDDKARVIADANILNCIKPEIPKIIDAILQSPAASNAPILPKYTDEDWRIDVASLKQALIDHGAYKARDIYHENFSAEYSAEITPNDIAVTEDDSPIGLRPDGSMSPATRYTFHAKFSDLLPATTIQHSPEGAVLVLECASGECVDIESRNTATGRGPYVSLGPKSRTNIIRIHINYDATAAGARDLLQLRRAIARLVSRTHSDREVCQAAAHVPSSPQCG